MVMRKETEMGSPKRLKGPWLSKTQLCLRFKIFFKLTLFLFSKLKMAWWVEAESQRMEKKRPKRKRRSLTMWTLCWSLLSCVCFLDLRETFFTLTLLYTFPFGCPSRFAPVWTAFFSDYFCFSWIFFGQFSVSFLLLLFLVHCQCLQRFWNT